MLMVPSTHGLVAGLRQAPAFTVAPYITGNTNGTDAYATDTLTARFTATGSPTPTVSYQWFAFNLAGQGAILIGNSPSINAQSAITGTQGNIIYCTVQISNALGSTAVNTPDMAVSLTGKGD